MTTQYEKTWRRFAFKERNNKICRLWSEGMKLNILCKRFGLSESSVRYILKGARLWTNKTRLGSDPLVMVSVVD